MLFRSQHDLQRLIFVAVQIEQRTEEIIPVTHQIIQHDYRDHRLGEGQYHRAEIPEVGTAVESRRLVELIRNGGLKKGSRNDQTCKSVSCRR